MRKIPSEIPLTIYSLSWIFNFFVEAYQECIRIPIKYLNTYPANICCFPRRLEDLLKMSWVLQFLVLQDVLKTFWRRLQDVFAKRLPKMSSRRTCKTSSSRRIEDVLQLYLEDVLETSWRRLGRQKNVTLKTSSVRLHQDDCLLGKIVLCAKNSFRKTPF